MKIQWCRAELYEAWRHFRPKGTSMYGERPADRAYAPSQLRVADVVPVSKVDGELANYFGKTYVVDPLVRLDGAHLAGWLRRHGGRYGGSAHYRDGYHDHQQQCYHSLLYVRYHLLARSASSDATVF